MSTPGAPGAKAAFALLDDNCAAAEAPASRLFTHWQRQLACHDVAQLDAWQANLQHALAQGLHAVLLADYEWGLPLLGLPVVTERDGQAWRPSLRAELFETLTRLRRGDVDAWLEAQCQLPAGSSLSSQDSQSSQAGLLAWQPGITQQQYAAQLAQIQAAIARGDTYQVNHTFAFEGLAYGSPIALYRSLRARQRAEFGALLHLPHAHPQEAWVLSLSPELFVRVHGQRITARPMKGTASAGTTEEEARTATAWLQGDAKNRAENVMIVDLLRNDLGRVARTGSVAVSDLFAVQRNAGVLSMTSTVTAQLPAEAGIADVLRATFPCGSITGAPKRQTMALIAATESPSVASAAPYRRGLYTGAIGWAELSATNSSAKVKAEAPAPLDYCLSVPIRTVLLTQPGNAAMPQQARLPVGAGIVWDSRADDEWRECHLKARFAQHDMAHFALFETMLLPAAALLPPHWQRHAQRLHASAQALGFAHAPGHWLDALQRYIAEHVAEQSGEADARPDWRLRMALQQDGSISLTHAPLDALPPQPVTLTLAPTPSRTPVWLRQHKTTVRGDYDAALQQAMARGAFDALFFNADDSLTEGARSNVFLRLEDGPDAPWLTPPVSDGVLPGVMRAVLLDDPNRPTHVQRLSRADVLAARAILVTNGLRGALPARLLPD